MSRKLTRFAATVGIAALIACGIAAGAAEPTTTQVNIAKNGIGVPPADFDFWRTGEGGPGKWAVVRDSTAAAGIAIEQFSMDQTENRYPLAIYKPLSVKNVIVGARFKLVAGTMQTAGIAVRLVSPGTYYVVAANALEGRVDLFRFVDGKRERIAGTEAEVARSRWHMLELSAEDDRFTVLLDKKRLFTALDRALVKDGHIALWTEEDNVTHFDQIEVTALLSAEHD